MDEAEKIAQERYDNGEKPSISTFIDEDTIIMGYGKLDYDFEFPLPMETIKKIHGTISWSELMKKDLPQQETPEEIMGKKVAEYCKQYEGTDKYNVAMLAVEFGYNLKK
jgi:hypothetical protein